MGKNKQLPQNIKNVLKEIGENAALFKLYLLSRDYGWRVAKNYDETGCDILLLRIQSDDFSYFGYSMIRIEVKTRQTEVSSNKSKRKIHFTLSENEKNGCDFVVAYYLDRHTFFIVPSKNLVKTAKTKAKKEFVYKFIAEIDKEGNYYKTTQKFADDWLAIRNCFSMNTAEREY